jgi:hypothetical protein
MASQTALILNELAQCNVQLGEDFYKSSGIGITYGFRKHFSFPQNITAALLKPYKLDTSVVIMKGYGVNG